MNYKIQEIEGIGANNAARLCLASISTTGDLLTNCSTARSRAEMSAVTGISSQRLLEWAQLANLMRINGVGRQYAELLWAAGIRNVAKLRNCTANEVLDGMERANSNQRFAKILPMERQAAAWISQAKAMITRVEE